MTRIAVFPIDAVGHLSSMLAVCGALVRDPAITGVRAFGGAELEGLFRTIGAEFTVTVRDGPDGPIGDLPWKSFIRPLGSAAETLRAVQDFAPDVVLFDPFSVLGALASRTTGLPSAAFVTMPGYGTLGEHFVQRHDWNRGDLLEANAAYVRRFGVDFQAEGALPVLFPTANISIVAALKSMAMPANPVTQPLLAKLVNVTESTIYVGHCAGAERLMEDAIRTLGLRGQFDPPVPFPFEQLTMAKRDGRRVVLFSLGTVLTDFRRASPVGGAPTGEDFLRRSLQVVTEAVRNDERLLLVAAIGLHFSSHTELQWPREAIVRATVPQHEILERFADVFITHHGANSQDESILAGVPMVSLPGVGDQIPNARMAQKHGLAVARWDLENPFGTCDAGLMGEALRSALDDKAYRRAAAAVGAEMRAAGGAEEAARHTKALAREKTPSAIEPRELR